MAYRNRGKLDHIGQADFEARRIAAAPQVTAVHVGDRVLVGADPMPLRVIGIEHSRGRAVVLDDKGRL